MFGAGRKGEQGLVGTLDRQSPLAAFWGLSWQESIRWCERRSGWNHVWIQTLVASMEKRAALYPMGDIA